MKRGQPMTKKASKPEQIINKLRESEILLSQGTTVGEASMKRVSPSRPITAGVKSKMACGWSRPSALRNRAGY